MPLSSSLQSVPVRDSVRKPESRSILELQNITKTYAAQSTPAVEAISLRLEQGNILGLLGPSGCGKTTLLRLIAGFESTESGSILLGDRLVSSPQLTVPTEERGVGMVFQDFALFPHLNVFENIAFGLKNSTGHLKRQRAAEFIQRRVLEVLELVGLDGLQRRYPHELSGGQQQRIALARALAPKPKLVLLDEPLSNLDVQVRLHLRQELRTILKAAQTSAVFVTHDQEEALAISDQVAVMRAGRIEQMGTPEAIYSSPASRFVADFVTQANFLAAQRLDKIWKTEVGAFEVEVSGVEASGIEVSGIGAPESSAFVGVKNAAEAEQVHLARGWLMIRQEALMLHADPQGRVVVRDRQFLGRDYRYCLQAPSGQRLHALSRDNSLTVGTTVRLSAQPETLRVFSDQAP